MLGDFQQYYLKHKNWRLQLSAELELKWGGNDTNFSEEDTRRCESSGQALTRFSESEKESVQLSGKVWNTFVGIPTSYWSQLRNVYFTACFQRSGVYFSFGEMRACMIFNVFLRIC